MANKKYLVGIETGTLKVSTSPTSGYVLTSDSSGNATWQAPSGGDVVGPASATDNAIVRYNGTTGELIQNSSIIIQDGGGIVDSNINADIDGWVGSVGFVSDDTTSPAFVDGIWAQYRTGANSAPSLLLARGKGSIASPAATAVNDALGYFIFMGTDDVPAMTEVTSLRSHVHAIWSGTPQGRMALYDEFNSQPYLELYPHATASGSYLRFTYGNGTDPNIIESVGSATNSGINLKPKGSGTVQANGVEVVTISGTQTLTNKRITPRVVSVSNTTSWTVDADAYDMGINTGLTGNVTVNAPTGTPTEGQKLHLAITGTAARTITWNSIFEASTTALPTTTVTTARLDVGFIWNAATSKWRCIAVA